MNVYLAVVLVYLALLIGVAVKKSRQVKTKADFMVAGRSVPTFLLVATLVCTWIGSGSLFGGAGLAFRMGIGDLWMSAGAWFGILAVMFLAARVRRIADYSVPELLERRYDATALAGNAASARSLIPDMLGNRESGPLETGTH